MLTKDLHNDKYLLQEIPGYQRAFHGVYVSDRMKPWFRSPEDDDLYFETDVEDLLVETSGIEDDTCVRLAQL